jgi:hypothetical protein
MSPTPTNPTLHPSPSAADLLFALFWCCSHCGQAIAKSGRKVKTVMVLVEARPRIIPEELINATSAIINAYLPGPCTLYPFALFFFDRKL